MSSSRRTVAVLLSLGGLAGLALLPTLGAAPQQAAPQPVPAQPGGVIIRGKAVLQPAPAGIGPAAPGGPSEFTDALTLPTDRDAKKRIDAAEDYIKEEAWGEASQLLQAL